MVFKELKAIDLSYGLKSFKALNLVIESEALQKNFLNDPQTRHNYVLAPLTEGTNWPVIFHLCGYFSTPFESFYFKNLNTNFVQKIDHGTFEKRLPQAVHVFVEANTFWGGSQFINSHGCGNYQDYIVKELYPAVVKNLAVSSDPLKTCVVGGSSGGYGALSLISQKESPFSMAFAVAPDSLFEMSLLPEIYQAAPELLKYKNFSALKKKIHEGEIQDKKSFFNLMNVVAMAHCYSPPESFQNDFIQLPIDLNSGKLNLEIWNHWLKQDPIHFLRTHKDHLKNKQVHLDVGIYDNYHLQFGTRQIYHLLQEQNVASNYSEFPGQHFGLTARKMLFLESLISKGWAHG